MILVEKIVKKAVKHGLMSLKCCPGFQNEPKIPKQLK